MTGRRTSKWRPYTDKKTLFLVVSVCGLVVLSESASIGTKRSIERVAESQNNDTKITDGRANPEFLPEFTDKDFYDGIHDIEDEYGSREATTPQNASPGNRSQEEEASKSSVLNLKTSESTNSGVNNISLINDTNVNYTIRKSVKEAEEEEEEDNAENIEDKNFEAIKMSTTIDAADDGERIKTNNEGEKKKSIKSQTGASSVVGDVNNNNNENKTASSNFPVNKVTEEEQLQPPRGNETGQNPRARTIEFTFANEFLKNFNKTGFSPGNPEAASVTEERSAMGEKSLTFQPYPYRTTSEEASALENTIGQRERSTKKTTLITTVSSLVTEPVTKSTLPEKWKSSSSQTPETIFIAPSRTATTIVAPENLLVNNAINVSTGIENFTETNTIMKTTYKISATTPMTNVIESNSLAQEISSNLTTVEIETEKKSTPDFIETRTESFSPVTPGVNRTSARSNSIDQHPTSEGFSINTGSILTTSTETTSQGIEYEFVGLTEIATIISTTKLLNSSTENESSTLSGYADDDFSTTISSTSSQLTVKEFPDGEKKMKETPSTSMTDEFTISSTEISSDLEKLNKALSTITEEFTVSTTTESTSTESDKMTSTSEQDFSTTEAIFSTPLTTESWIDENSTSPVTVTESSLQSFTSESPIEFSSTSNITTSANFVITAITENNHKLEIATSTETFLTVSETGPSSSLEPEFSTSSTTEYEIPDNRAAIPEESAALLVRIIFEASWMDVCPHLPALKQSLAYLLSSGLDANVIAEQIIIQKNPCTDGVGSSSSSSVSTESSVPTLLLYVVDKNGNLDPEMTKILPSLYNKSPIKLQVTIGSFQLVQEADSGNAIAVVVVSCVALICLVLLAGLLFIMRKRQTRFNYGERCRPVSLDAYSLDSVSAYNSVRGRKGTIRASKRSYGNPSFEDSTAIPSHPLNFAGLSAFCNEPTAIAEEFAGIPQVTARIDELPQGAEVKNRYANVVPLPETRVTLAKINDDPLSEYINASYVRGPKNATKYYIACQAPIETTVTDFWRMIWEQQSKVIIMLTDLVENGVEKCAEYLPPSEVTDCHRLFGDFQITLKKRETKEKYAISTLHLKNLENNTFREIWHIWYLWPANGVQSDCAGLIAVLLEARALQRGGPGPIVVHCSPGTGRTGTLIALDLGIRQYEITRTVDVPRVVYTIRRDRAGAVQTNEQYAFVYKALNLYATKLAGGALES